MTTVSHCLDYQSDAQTRRNDTSDAQRNKFDEPHAPRTTFICIFWEIRFVHQTVDIPVLDVHLFHQLVVAQKMVNFTTKKYLCRMTAKNNMFEFQPD